MTEAVQVGTRSFGLQAEFLEARSYEEVKKALRVVAAVRPGAMVILSDGTLFGQHPADRRVRAHTPPADDLSVA